jgi:hypothetical protein
MQRVAWLSLKVRTKVRTVFPDKPYYRTTDACGLLGIKPELFRYRLYTGKYPEVKRDGKGRLLFAMRQTEWH